MERAITKNVELCIIKSKNKENCSEWSSLGVHLKDYYTIKFLWSGFEI